jgi:hypothetical protein
VHNTPENTALREKGIGDRGPKAALKRPQNKSQFFVNLNKTLFTPCFLLSQV